MKKSILILLVILSSWNIRANSSIHVDHYGKGSSVVIIAGLGGPESWKSTIDVLKLKNSCYVVSVAGLSGDKNTDDPDFIKTEKEIVDWLKAEKIAMPVLIGHSFGGILAMQIASDNPSMFKKLVLVDSYPFALSIYNPAFTPELGIQQAAMVKKQLTEMPVSTYNAFWDQNVKQLTADTLFQKSILQKILDSQRNFIAGAQAFVLSNDLRPKLHNVQCPVVTLCSSYVYKKAGLTDDIIKERMNDQFRSISKCDIFINDQTRHFIMIDSKDWFLAKLQENI